MSNLGSSIEHHYFQRNLGRSILSALQELGKDLKALTVDDLAPVDEFHVRGREATLDLAELAIPTPDMHVLDIGCGIGGPSRLLAHKFGCRVTGIDITEEYCQVADELAQRTGLGHLVDYRHGDAIQMPFDPASFDIAWTQHTTMNIPDKPGLFAEIYRLTRPGGRLVSYEVLSGDGGPPHFPVPWAGEPSISFLSSAPQMRQDISNAGFRIDAWNDVTQLSLDWFHRFLARARERGPSPLGLHLVMGRDAREKIGNMVRNLEEDRIRVVQLVAVRA